MADLRGLLDAMSGLAAARMRLGGPMPRVRQARAQRAKAPGCADRPGPRRAHRTPLTARLTAWLGLFAIWLAIVAPVVTQLLPAPSVASAAARADVRAQLGAALCSAHNAVLPFAARASHVRDPALDPNQPSHDDHHAKACGYCNLLAHSPLIGGAAFVAVVPLVASHRVLALRVRHVLPLPRFAFATPRGPPQTVA